MYIYIYIIFILPASSSLSKKISRNWGSYLVFTIISRGRNLEFSEVVSLLAIQLKEFVKWKMLIILGVWTVLTPEA